jgi:hypothetical protein
MNDLAIGTTYIANGGLVKLSGKVTQDSIEYIHGARFYSTEGLFYSENGSRLMLRNNKVIKSYNAPTRSTIYDIKRVASHEDVEAGSVEFFQLDHATLQDNKKYIPRDDYDFTLRSGSCYINRTGNIITIIGVCRFISDLDDVGTIFRGTAGQMFNKDGDHECTMRGRISMRDLIYMVI